MIERVRAFFDQRDWRVWAILAMAITCLLYLSTFQTVVNGSDSPYTTDVGEIQNALPRWGTIHWTGYPLYTFLGSSFVTLLRWVGVPPAAGASLFSVLWGIVSVGLMVALLQELHVSGPLSALGALLLAVSTSVWMDASLAEVHTMTTALTIAILLFALRLGRSGDRRDLFLLALVFSQSVAHQRAVVFTALAAAVLVLEQWRVIWREFLPTLTLCLLSPLTYLYLPWRVSQGATWIFGTPGTWQRVMGMLLDNRAERIVAWPEGVDEWMVRIGRAFTVTAMDLPLVLLVLGLFGVLALALEKRWQESLGLTLAWVPHLLLTGVIWIGRVGDAQLAAHLPVTILAVVGVAFLADFVSRRITHGRSAASLLLAGIFILLFVLNRPTILKVTRDPSAEVIVSVAERVELFSDDEPITFMALWGNDYWALAYAQAFQDRLVGLNFVDHNASFQEIVDRGDHLFTFDQTFYWQPVSWWEERLGRVYLVSAAPEIVEIAVQPPLTLIDVPAGPDLDLGNGMWIRSAQLTPLENGDWVLTVYWQAESAPTVDYSVAVHLVSWDPPRSGEDVLFQADQAHPVYGWYPTSRWDAGEIVREHYLIKVPEGAAPQAVRIALYYTDDAGDFVNSPWLSLPAGD
ncbi:MAG: DUF2723 domain-containing protein [Chloroflexi bacterium]|nr:DUF2723 domain-containing protein [Chloroflexota bacterium]